MSGQACLRGQASWGGRSSVQVSRGKRLGTGSPKAERWAEGAQGARGPSPGGWRDAVHSVDPGGTGGQRSP